MQSQKKIIALTDSCCTRVKSDVKSDHFFFPVDFLELWITGDFSFLKTERKKGINKKYSAVHFHNAIL